MSMREESKKEYSHNIPSCIEAINTGSLQRIADATEAMAKNFIQMQKDLNYYRNRLDEKSGESDMWYRKYCAMKGVVTKLKKR